MEAYFRHVNAYKFFRPFLKPFLKGKFAFEYKSAPNVEEPYIVLSNHNSDFDPMLVGLSFPRHMYFVASEHIFRAGILSRLLSRYFAPIPRIKGSIDAGAAWSVLRQLRKGRNVCIFAEGNRSFNGLTGEIPPSTGRLIITSGAALVTYKLEGGYFTSPRWSRSLRHGRMKGYCVNVYTPAQLKAMSVEDVNRAIANDLYEDAYERQREAPVKFKGRRLAEGLESALCICPRCGEIDVIKTEGSKIRCTGCSAIAEYTPYGYIEGKNFPFTTVTEWDRWQEEEYIKLAGNETANPLFSDPGATLKRIETGHKSKLISSGLLSLSKNSLNVENNSFALDNISGMSIYGRNVLVFTDVRGIHYELNLKKLACARKYLSLYKILRLR